MFTRTLKMMALACCVTPLPPARSGEDAEQAREALEGARQNIRREQMREILSRFTPQTYDQLFEAAQEYPAAVRFSLIYDLLASYPGHEERGRAGIATRHIIRYLVGHLSDSDAFVRNLACSNLYEGVADVSLRDFTRQILDAVQGHPGTRWAARLVGKLGSASARDLLKAPQVVQEMTRQDPVPEGEERNIAYEARQVERRNLMKFLDAEAAQRHHFCFFYAVGVQVDQWLAELEAFVCDYVFDAGNAGDYALGMAAIRLGASTKPSSSSPDDVSVLSIGYLIEEEFAE